MKVVILCGGKGTRLREETEIRPKPLIPIGEMPILWHIMKIYSHYGYKKFILCLGYKGEMIKNYFLNFEELMNDFTLNLRSNHKRINHINASLEDWEITFINTGLHSNTGERIKAIQPYVDKDEKFMLTYGDGVSDININKLVEYHSKMKKIATLTGINPTTFYGTLEVKNGIAKSFKEKPTLEGIANGGFFIFENKIFNYLKEKNSILEETPLRTLASEGNLAVYKHTGFWYSMDTFKQVEELNKMWDSGKRPWKVW